jgi:hypothetical protein
MTNASAIGRPSTSLLRTSGRMINPRSDPLPALLGQLTDRAGEPCAILRAASRPWASALFQGRRHVITLQFDGDDMAARLYRFSAGLSDTEWTLPGHFVADITIDAQSGETLELSALTIEEW